MPHHFHRMVFRDLATLADLLDGHIPDIATFRRRLFVSERNADRYTPDHVQKNLLAHNLKNPTTQRALIVGSLSALANHYLEVRGGRPWVRGDRFESWQTLLTWLAPLPLMTTALWRSRQAPNLDLESVQRYADQVLIPVFQFSATPAVHDPIVESLIRQNGLQDLHIHLNGTTEVDAVWLDVLLQRRAFQAEILKVGGKEAVLEQYSQIEIGLTPDAVAQEMRIARRVRLIATNRLFNRPPFGVTESCQDICDLWQLVARNGDASDQLAFDNQHDLLRHPMRVEFGLGSDHCELVCEALWLTLVLEHIERHDDEMMARLLHTYLLILNGHFVPLCVQQEDQVGFDQFQKITINGVREASEQDYLLRFRQVSYSPAGDLSLLEGRIAPKVDFSKMVKLLRAVLNGFARFHGLQPHEYDPSIQGAIPRKGHRLDLRLVAHFIKEDETGWENRSKLCRFHDLRLKFRRQLRILIALRERYPGFRHYLTGLDAAANELHTPPEVFAPLYRAARRAGFHRFSYHVGEDFEHLLSGIRAVYEAVKFLDLQAGDRIGHGTAIGIDPSLWMSRSLKQIAKRQGDWLDDLVFAHAILGRTSHYPGLHGKIEPEIARLSQLVYGERIAPVLLEQAWCLRHLDPLIVCDPLFDPLAFLDEGIRVEWKEAEGAKHKSPESIALLRRYHSPEVVERAQIMYLVDNSALPEGALVDLQLEVVKELNSRRVAVECPPTSNVRISVYDSYEEHHLFRWLGLRRPGEPKPIVCLSTDDPGIFATNMRNEMVHLHRTLRDCFDKSEPEAITLLNALSLQSDAFVFKDSNLLFGESSNHNFAPVGQ
jgi:adenosine deaminase